MRQDRKTIIGIALVCALFVMHQSEAATQRKSLLSASIGIVYDLIRSSIHASGSGNEVALPLGFHEKATSVNLRIRDDDLSTKTIVANQGEQVKIKIINEGMHTHNLIIPQYRIVSRNLNHGEENYIEFTANDPGTYQFFSDSPGHIEKGLTGRLHILRTRG